MSEVNTEKITAPKAPHTEPDRVRLRAILTGMFLSLLICALTPYNNSYLHGTPLGGGHFPLAPFFILIWLTVILAILARIFRSKTWLTGKELLTAWIMMVISSGIAYTGLVRTFFINLTAPIYFSTMGNRWKEVIQPNLPDSWHPRSRETIEAMYNGLDGGRDMSWTEVFSRVPWSEWIGPLLAWGVFILLCYLVMICLVNLLSRQWLKNERMNFPLLRVPQLMEEAMDQGRLGTFLTDRYLLVGVAIPVLLHTLNGLHFYFPSVPQLPTLVLAGSYFPKFGLFSAFTKMKIYFYPAFIGFAFLTSRQISFSMWFFYILGGLMIGMLSAMGYNIPAAALGVTFGPHLTRPEETQMIGAYLVFFLFIVWLARSHLISVVKTGFGIGRMEPDDTEWVSIRLAFWGLVIGGAALVAWLVWFGMPLVTTIVVLAMFLIVTLVASRIICQGGLAYFSLTAAPIDGILAFAGPGFFTNMGLVMAAVVQKVLFVDFRESLMPSLFHASAVNRRSNPKKLIIGGILVTLAAAVVVSFIAMLTLCYKYGVRELNLEWATRTTVTVLDNAKALIDSPVSAGKWVQFFSVAGALIMLGLVLCYHRFHWWPLHPLGYLVAYSNSIRILWFSFFLGWLVNALCMRYGGVVLFKRLRYLFIGLIIGDFLMGGLWAVIGMFGDASYLVLPD